MENDVEIIYKDYKKTIEQLKQKVDVVFVDPPYEKDIAVKAIELILDKNILQQDGLIILETDHQERELEELKNIKKINIKDLRQYGRVKLIFLSQEKKIERNEI